MSKHPRTKRVGSLLEIAVDKPVEALGRCREELAAAKGEYRLVLYNVLGASCAAGRLLRDQPEQWSEFVQLPFWKSYHRKLGERPERSLLRLVLMAVLDARSRAGRKRASKYAKALQQYFDDDTDPAQIPDLILQHRGLEKLARLARGRQAGDSRGRHSKKALRDEWAGTGTQKEKNCRQRASKRQHERSEEGEEPEASGRDSSSRVDGECELWDENLHLEIGAKRLRRLLRMPRGRRAELIIECIGMAPNGWRRMKVTRCKRLKRQIFNSGWE